MKPSTPTQKLKVDVALVIDRTGSMCSVIDDLKNELVEMTDKLKELLLSRETRKREISELNVKVVFFGDFATDGEEALICSPLFKMPEEKEHLLAFLGLVNGGEYSGGDIPENGLEGLYAAMTGEWSCDENGNKADRQIILLVTDAPPLHLQEREDCVGYNREAYPESLRELEDIWHDEELLSEKTSMDRRARRLFLIAPEEKYYEGHTWRPVADWEDTRSILLPHIGPLFGLTADTLIKAIASMI